jgi:hypothetical protein
VETGVPLDLSRPRVAAAVALSMGCVLGLAACGAGSLGTGDTGTRSGAASSPAVAAATVPSSCSGIPEPVVAAYMGPVSSVKPLGTQPNQVSCEFFGPGSGSITILNVGKGTPALFDVARARSAGGGRTITTIPGLGTQAFQISNGSLVRGMEAISQQGVIVSVSSTLSAAQDKSLIAQLFQMY